MRNEYALVSMAVLMIFVILAAVCTGAWVLITNDAEMHCGTTDFEHSKALQHNDFEIA